MHCSGNNDDISLLHFEAPPLSLLYININTIQGEKREFFKQYSIGILFHKILSENPSNIKIPLIVKAELLNGA